MNYDLSKINLGNDEAEQDQSLKEYFLKTSSYKNSLNGSKTIIIGRKGSGKSAIFKLMKDELEEMGSIVIPITPDQYSWSALKDYKELEILPLQAHTNAWRMTLLSSVIWKLNQEDFISKGSKLVKYYQKYMKDAYIINEENWLFGIVGRIKERLAEINALNTPIGGVGIREKNAEAIPLRVTDELKTLLIEEWPDDLKVRILIDRLDDSWDATEESKNLIIGLLKAANEINAIFKSNIIITIFLRSDIYDTLIFDDKDKLRQYEETLFWNNDNLKAVVCERIRLVLVLKKQTMIKYGRIYFQLDYIEAKHHQRNIY